MAAAVAAAVMVPVGAQAEVSVYGRVNNVIELNNVHVDNSLWYGGIGAFPGSRSSNTIKYANAVGPISMQVDLRLNGSQEAGTEALAGDGGGIGLQAAVNDNFTLGFAYDSEDKSDNMMYEYKAAKAATATAAAVPAVKGMGPESDWVGVSAMATLGQFWGSLAWANNEVTNNHAAVENADTDYTQLWAGLRLSDSASALIGYGQSESEGSSAKPSVVTVGGSYNFGGGLRLWYEGNGIDDDDGSETSAVHYVGLRFDF